MSPKFSVEDVDCETVLDCLYDLSKVEKKVLSILGEDEELRTRDVAEEIDKDQSTAYRALEKLVGCGIVYKEKRTIRNGGYYYVYSARPMEHVQEEAKDCLNEWYENMKDAIDNMD